MFVKKRSSIITRIVNIVCCKANYIHPHSKLYFYLIAKKNHKINMKHRSSYVKSRKKWNNRNI